MKNLILILSLFFATSQVHATIYFTRASGDWTNVNIWSTTGCGGVTAGTVPGSGDIILICNTYTVDITSNISCVLLTILPGGVLNCNAGGVLSSPTIIATGGMFNLNSGTFSTTSPFDLTGTFNISSGTFTTTSSFDIDPLGVLNMTGGALYLTGGSGNKLENYGTINQSGGLIDVTDETEIEHGGVYNISGTANYISRSDFNLVFGSGGNITMTGGTMTFMADFLSNHPDNYFNQTAGAIKFTGMGSEWRMKAIYNASGTAQAIFDGETKLYLLSAGDFNFYDLIINPGKIMDQNNADTISVSHDWINLSGTYIPNYNRVVFNGVEDQHIGGNSATTFYDISIHNIGTLGNDNVILELPTTVSNSILFNDGIVNSTSVNLLTVTNTSTTASNDGNAGSFISGPMAWNLTTGGTYVFPTGKAPINWARAAISDLTGPTYFTAEYFKAGYGASDTSDMNEPLDKVSVVEYWDLAEADADVDAAVTLYWEDASYSGIISCTPGGDLVIGHFGSKWDDMGNGGGITGSCAGPGSSGTVKSGIVTSFSPFTFASGGSLNPLPIELLSFEAKQNGNTVELFWQTATQIDNDYFTIEKTVNGNQFEVVTYVPGAGNSTSPINYTALDKNPFNRVSYYRLKQTDYDGNFSFSDLEMVIFEKHTLFDFEIYPNPTDGVLFNVQINSNSEDEVLVVVFDILGNELYSKIIVTNNGGTAIYAIDPSQKLPSGVYMITATSHQKIYKKRLVVN